MQEPNYSAVSLGDLASDRAAIAGQYVHTTGLLATISDGAALRAGPVDGQGLVPVSASTRSVGRPKAKVTIFARYRTSMGELPITDGDRDIKGQPSTVAPATVHPRLARRI